MKEIKEGDIVRHCSQDIVGEVLDISSSSITIRTSDSPDPRKFLNPENFKEITGADMMEIEIYPEQKELKLYIAKSSAKNQETGRLFKLLMLELFKVVGWRPGIESWQFSGNVKRDIHPVLRIHTGRTSQIFHFWAWEGITIAVDASKICPPKYQKYFPKKGWYYGGDSVDIDPSKLTEGVIMDYVSVLTAIYRHNSNLKNKP